LEASLSSASSHYILHSWKISKCCKRLQSLRAGSESGGPSSTTFGTAPRSRAPSNSCVRWPQHLAAQSIVLHLPVLAIRKKAIAIVNKAQNKSHCSASTQHCCYIAIAIATGTRLHSTVQGNTNCLVDYLCSRASDSSMHTVILECVTAFQKCYRLLRDAILYNAPAAACWWVGSGRCICIFWDRCRWHW
jgi:hypothetical protein